MNKTEKQIGQAAERFANKTESDIVARLFILYSTLTHQQYKKGKQLN